MIRCLDELRLCDERHARIIHLLMLRVRRLEWGRKRTDRIAICAAPVPLEIPYVLIRTLHVLVDLLELVVRRKLAFALAQLRLLVLATA